MGQDLAIVLTTVGSNKEAESLSDILAKSKYVACINILPDIKSKYMWKGELQNSKELILMIKTRKDYFKYLESLIMKNHSYQVPEILCIDIANISDDYSNWIISELNLKKNK